VTKPYRQKRILELRLRLISGVDILSAVECNATHQSIMKNLRIAYFLAVPALMVGCVRASFSPLVDDSGTTGHPEAGADIVVDAVMCQATPLVCTPAPSPLTPCDPLCQTGVCPNWCTQKCSFAGDDGTPVCETKNGAGQPGDACTISNQSRHDQNDTCAPGNICLGDYGNPISNTHCFSLCRGSEDCNNVACNQRPVAPPTSGTVPTASVCDPSYLTCTSTSASPCCNPLASAAINSPGCAVGEVCYLVPQRDSNGNNRTVCEYWSGSGSTGALCNSSTDCFPGWFCNNKGGQRGVCLQVCDPNSSAANPCTCSPYGNQFGYCM